ncbi:hypothetical protein [Streptomyces mirabilis]|uniref:hypothetical protein n=1 Tax=Streptomyces mirabilis TaxID=68239 RepID=UPI00225BB187|nr:hypothetical protein [Streptomyces mirabilis]MCX4433443.1 hypothetical protein [Streptomyces mirabilis]
MSQLSALGVTDADLSPRLKFVNILPSALLLAVVISLILGGAPAHAPGLHRLLDNARSYGWTGAVVASVGALVAGLLLQPLELASIRLLEGYVSSTGLLGPLARMGTWVHASRRSRLTWQHNHLKHEDPRAVTARFGLALMPHRAPVLPTALGNRLRAAEERAGRPYGLDSLLTWPRLYHVLPQDVLQTVARSRNELDTAARLSLSFALTSVMTTGLLLTHPWWLLLPAALAVLSWFAYRAAVHAATTYGDTVAAVVDVFRLKLLQEMHIAIPADTAGERALNKKLTALWSRKDRNPLPSPVKYDAGEAHPGDQAGSGGSP